MNFTIENGVLEKHTEEKGVSKVTVPATVREIGDSAFEDCRNITDVVLPNTVSVIGEKAFEDCTSLQKITTNGGAGGFKSLIAKLQNMFGKGKKRINLSQNVSSIGRWAFNGCINFNSIDIDAKNSTYKSIDGIVYSKDGTKLILCPGGRETAEIPQGVVSIEKYAFYSCSQLKSVTIPDSVRMIDDFAFYACINLTSINIPEGVQYIGKRAFNCCSRLKNISIPKTVEVFGKEAFHDTQWFEEYSGKYVIEGNDVLIQYRGKDDVNITLPNNIKSIGKRAFEYCRNLKSVVLNEGVVSIQSGAFMGCYNLEHVELPEMGNMGAELFAMSWVQSVVLFFSYLGWALFAIGLVVACFECGVEYSGGRGNVKETALNAMKGFLAVSLFTQVPVRLYELAVSLQADLTAGITGFGTTSIGDAAKAALEDFNAVESLTSSGQIILRGFGPVTSGLMVIFCLALMAYAVIKVFFANLKRGGILLIQIAVGSLYMFSVPRGYGDGFIQWCKQVVGLCLTAFLQATILVAGLMVFKDHALLGLGLMLSAGEISR